MRFPGNCLLVAGAAWLAGREVHRVVGYRHWYWRDDAGLAWHFSSGPRGRPTCVLLYLGEVRRYSRGDMLRMKGKSS